MTFDELNDEQRLELKQRMLVDRDDKNPEGPSYGELADADLLVSDDEARKWAEGMEFSEDDFACSATPVFRVRVTWPVHKTFQVPADSKEEAFKKIRRVIEDGGLSCWDPGWEADDGENVPTIELEDD